MAGERKKRASISSISMKIKYRPYYPGTRTAELLEQDVSLSPCHAAPRAVGTSGTGHCVSPCPLLQIGLRKRHKARSQGCCHCRNSRIPLRTLPSKSHPQIFGHLSIKPEDFPAGVVFTRPVLSALTRYPCTELWGLLPAPPCRRYPGCPHFGVENNAFRAVLF